MIDVLSHRFSLISGPAGQLVDLPDHSVDLCMTSPPYLARHGFSYGMIADLAVGLKRVLKPSSLLFFNFGFVSEEPGRVHRVWNLLDANLTYGFDICWAFANETEGRFTPQPMDTDTPRPHRVWEPIYVFANGSTWNLDRLAIGVPYSDSSNSSRWGHGRTTRCRGNYWLIPYENKTGQEFHEHQWPKELVNRILRFAGLSTDSVVLDPFAGSGLSLLRAIAFGFRAVGYEKREDRALMIQEKLNGLQA